MIVFPGLGTLADVAAAAALVRVAAGFTLISHTPLARVTAAKADHFGVCFCLVWFDCLIAELGRTSAMQDATTHNHSQPQSTHPPRRPRRREVGGQAGPIGRFHVHV